MVKDERREKVGYARVSSDSQKLDSQIDLLKRAGCKKIYKDKVSGIKTNRPGWDGLMDYIRSGDSIVVTELSRMSRSLPHLLELTDLLEKQDVNVISLRENIDTTTATGRFFVSMMGAISQMERELKHERVTAGREAARARGRSGGRPKMSESKLEQARVLLENTKKSSREICDSLGIGRRTLFYYLKRMKGNSNVCSGP